jgi:hypothetical protein
VAVYTPLVAHVGEDLVITHTFDEDVTGWALAWALLDPSGAELLAKVPVITAPREAQTTVTASDLTRAAGSYQHSLSRTDPGAHALLGYGPFHLLSPPVHEEPAP